MKEHDWMKLYADAEKFMKKVGGTDFNIKTNIKTERWTSVSGGSGENGFRESFYS